MGYLFKKCGLTKRFTKKFCDRPYRLELLQTDKVCSSWVGESWDIFEKKRITKKYKKLRGEECEGDASENLCAVCIDEGGQIKEAYFRLDYTAGCMQDRSCPQG